MSEGSKNQSSEKRKMMNISDYSLEEKIKKKNYKMTFKETEEPVI